MSFAIHPLEESAMRGRCPAPKTVENLPGANVIGFAFPIHQEWHISVWPLAGETPDAMGLRLVTLLKQHRAIVVRQEVFAPLAGRKQMMSVWEREFGGIDWPVTWVESDSENGGMHVLAVSGVPVETVRCDGRVVGKVFSDGDARHCLLGDLCPADGDRLASVQCRELFGQMERALAQTGMTMAHVSRTWFFFDDILADYNDFNQVRNGFFSERHMFNRILPASTGIGARNANGSAIVGGAWAVQPLDACPVQAAMSPLQNPSIEYGSAFSRAVVIDSGGARRLLVSGTASIDPAGRSVHRADTARQIALTMDVVQEILKSNGFHLSEAVRATAYFREAGDVEVFRAWQRKHGIRLAPLVMTGAVVCRDELLFEIEIDIVSH